MCKRLPIKTLIVQSACDVKGVFGARESVGESGSAILAAGNAQPTDWPVNIQTYGAGNNSNAKINRLCAERSICSGKTNFCDCFLNGGQHLL